MKVQAQEYRMNSNMIAILQFQIPEYKDDQSPFFRQIVKNSWFVEAYDIILHGISLQLTCLFLGIKRIPESHLRTFVSFPSLLWAQASFFQNENWSTSLPNLKGPKILLPARKMREYPPD